MSTGKKSKHRSGAPVPASPALAAEAARAAPPPPPAKNKHRDAKPAAKASPPERRAEPDGQAVSEGGRSGGGENARGGKGEKTKFVCGHCQSGQCEMHNPPPRRARTPSPPPLLMPSFDVNGNGDDDESGDDKDDDGDDLAVDPQAGEISQAEEPAQVDSAEDRHGEDQGNFNPMEAQLALLQDQMAAMAMAISQLSAAAARQPPNKQAAAQKPAASKKPASAAAAAPASAANRDRASQAQVQHDQRAAGAVHGPRLLGGLQPSTRSMQAEYFDSSSDSGDSSSDNDQSPSEDDHRRRPFRQASVSIESAATGFDYGSTFSKHRFGRDHASAEKRFNKSLRRLRDGSSSAPPSIDELPERFQRPPTQRIIDRKDLPAPKRDELRLLDGVFRLLVGIARARQYIAEASTVQDQVNGLDAINKAVDALGQLVEARAFDIWVTSSRSSSSVNDLFKHHAAGRITTDDINEFAQIARFSKARATLSQLESRAGSGGGKSSGKYRRSGGRGQSSSAGAAAPTAPAADAPAAGAAAARRGRGPK